MLLFDPAHSSKQTFFFYQGSNSFFFVCFLIFFCLLFLLFSTDAFPLLLSLCLWFVVGLKSCLSEPISAGCVAKNSSPCCYKLQTELWERDPGNGMWHTFQQAQCSEVTEHNACADVDRSEIPLGDLDQRIKKLVCIFYQLKNILQARRGELRWAVRPFHWDQSLCTRALIFLDLNQSSALSQV